MVGKLKIELEQKPSVLMADTLINYHLYDKD